MAEQETNGGVRTLKAHVALNVRSVERSIEFYKKMLGIEPSKVRPRYAKFDVVNPPLNLTLNEVAFKERGALSHLGIQVAATADVLAMRERWAEAGLVSRDEMQTNCCYALQDKTWVSDPDGNEWEAFVVLADNLTETAACCAAEQADAETAAEGASACATNEEQASDATQAQVSSCCGATPATVAISR
ncbi:MAG TPA: ArsI/CadI family heavy metal resistance metalloenzyme [Pyrinomonadaceae bacterium]|nr:ArsI/CadI family heavy metal resistance metalloenzyme [Pyrinomonadaceae bacterium]